MGPSKITQGTRATLRAVRPVASLMIKFSGPLDDLPHQILHHRNASISALPVHGIGPAFVHQGQQQSAATAPYATVRR